MRHAREEMRQKL